MKETVHKLKLRTRSATKKKKKIESLKVVEVG